jgi:hypothetical protein
MPIIKLRRGQKLCKNCEQPNASRQRECKWCGTAFISKNTPLRGEIKEWQSLVQGDLFRVVNGSGPYYTLKTDSEDGVEGEKMSMGHRGSYKVDRVIEKGIISFGISRKNRGMAFIYMGEDKVSKATNVYHTPHRIIKIKTRPKRL